MTVAKIIRDTVLTTILAICAERVINKFKKWWYSSEDIDVNNIHIDIIPERVEDETVLITQVAHHPKVYKYFSDVR